MEALRPRPTLVALLLLAVVGIGALAVGPIGAASAPQADASSHLATSATPVNGTIQGPSVLGISSTGGYYINGSGGPAYAANGTKIGNLSYYVTVVGPNTTGVVFAPTRNNITDFTSPLANLTVSTVLETLTIDVMISSTYGAANASINFSYQVRVVQPYVVAATLVDRSTADLLAFTVQVALDGTVVGTVEVPSMTAGGTYDLAYSYVTGGLGSGWHTFSISLAQEHGLVTFANGSTVFSESFYVAPAAPNYTIWYAAGAVAFIGVLFILVTRVAARRRGVTRR